ncbi:hypothetical protein DYI25_19310 [Mesobacillus boroniphilus]|uniref:Putative Flp pilus-assembly TadG-like N-terminal domain-containing protein n=1 Tax=Mesobacillus boroniphilus TaxID=308892 RepID=A0A944GZ89_9BACI|nr:Tad domain-containing protein [Mesobacillus boroniphilus]MBS8266575.1 hypothetical protein [Mesobacillus boroniphilus]
MKRIKGLLSEEKGQSLVLVAIFMVVLIGFAGLAIDGGRLYIAKSQLQKAVDAGALAGADIMVDGVNASGVFNHTDSETEAKVMAVKNYNSNMPYEVSFPEDNIIKVYGKENVPLLLMPVLGMADTTLVVAEARAEVGRLKRVVKNTIIPIGIHINDGFELTFGEVWNLTESPGDGSKGNFNLLDFSTLPGVTGGENGSQGVAYYINNGSPVPIEAGTTTVYPQTGDPINSNAIKTAITALEGQIVYVPIVSEFSQGSSDPVTITGFAAFRIDDFYKDRSVHTIKATFIKTVLPGEIGTVVEEYGTYASQLIY